MYELRVAKRTPEEDVLVGGLDDWADCGWIMQSVRLTGETDPVALREATLALMDRVMRTGLMVPGDIRDGVHITWDGNPDEWVSRISREWITEWGTNVPTPGAVTWLCNTAAGDEIARAVLARETR